MWIIVTWLSAAVASPCGPLDTLEAAAEGGWMMDSERACVSRYLRRTKRFAEASRLLLADAKARGDEWTWRTLAAEHAERVPGDMEVFVALIQDAVARGQHAEIVRWTSMALAAAPSWPVPSDHPSVVALHRHRTYAALAMHRGAYLDATVADYARAWLEVAKDEAPAFAKNLAKRD